MNCSVCGKSYQTYDETKACYNSHQTDATEEADSPPTLDALKNLLHQRSEPIKHIGPKKAALEGEDTPQNWVNILIGMAKDGNGKITLPEIRFRLQDKSITLYDVRRWFAEYAADVRVEQRIGNTLYLDFGQIKRGVKRVGDGSMALANREMV